MTNIFTMSKFSDDFSEKINIDDLYEKKRQSDIHKLEIYKKILNRIHVRIKTVSKQSLIEKSCWYIVPEMILGVPKFDQGACIAYVMNALQENGFQVKYFHPNTIFISWNHWIPLYMRNEIKKKTGKTIDQFGNLIQEVDEDAEDDRNLLDSSLMVTNEDNSTKPSGLDKQYTPIASYKPSGKLVYNEDLLNRIGRKIS
jgi:hypothetical protein